MDWYVTSYAVPFLVAAAAALGVSWYVLREWSRERHEPWIPALFALSVGASWWALTYALRLSSAGLAGKLLWLRLEYLGSGVVPVAWVVLTYAYTSRGAWITRRHVALLSAVPCATVLLVWTNPTHGLMWTVDGLRQVGTITVLDRTFGPGLYVYAAYSYLLVAVGVARLLRYAQQTPAMFRGQAYAMIGSVVAPLAANALFVFGNGEAGHLEFSAAGFAVTALVFVVASERYRLFDLVPVGRAVALESVPDGLFIVDARLRLVDANRAAKSLVETSASGDADWAYGQPLSDVFPPLSAFVDDDRVEAQTGSVDVTVAGEDRVYTVGFEPVDSGRGSAKTSHRGWTVLVRDVTAQRRRERELERTNERLDDFATVVSHDLRNPLSIAEGYLQLARETDDEEAFDRATDAIERMDDIVDDVLYMARENTAAESTTELSVESVVRAAWETVVTGSATLEFESEFEDDLVVAADRAQLRRLFENLLRNAIEHGDASVVRVGEVVDGQETVGVFLADDGPGVPESDREAVFEQGTSNDGGSGLGLAIVEDVATNHGWDVSLTEGRDGGARVELVWGPPSLSVTAVGGRDEAENVGANSGRAS